MLLLNLHWRDLGRPEALVTALDPRPAAAIFTVTAQGAGCSVAILGKQALALPLAARCEAEAMQSAMTAQAAVAGSAGAMFKAMAVSAVPVSACRQRLSASARTPRSSPIGCTLCCPQPA